MASVGHPAPESTDSLLGEVLGGRYRVIELIARGGMGRIYKAEQLELGRIVALKILDDTNHDPEGFRKRFTLEASTSAKLSHPNIVVVHDYGSFELEGRRRHFMAMEFIDGPTLSQLLKGEGGRLPLERALFITREIARALRDAHKNGVVHRDLKPSNVMLVDRADGEHVKVVDFGIAKVAQGPEQDDPEGEQLTREGMFVGTPRYMSPEQLSGDPVDARSDIYSLGVLLYQMVGGRTPHAAKDAVQALLVHLKEPTPELPAEVVGEVPVVVRDIIRTCLQKNPADRFQDATAFIRALAAASSASQGSTTSSTEFSARLSGDYALTSSSVTPIPGEAQGLPSIPTPAPVLGLGDSAPRGALPGSDTPRPAPTSRGLWIAAALVVGLLAIGGLAWSGLPAGQPADPPPTSSSPPPTLGTVTPPATSARPPEPTPPTVVEPVRFGLTIDSTPRGASVLEGTTPIGHTPLTVELEAEPLRATPRTYRVELRGFAPYEFTQGASERDLTVHAALVALRSRPIRRSTPEGDGQPVRLPPPEDRMLKTSR